MTKTKRDPEAGRTGAPRIPDGFRQVKLVPNPFLEMVGPLYGRLEGDDFVLGFIVESKHCNPAAMCHGGMLMTLADMLLILCSNVQARLGRYLTTVSVTNDFLAPAPQGSWLEGRGQVLRVTKTLVFTQATLNLDGAVVMRTSGILKPVGEADMRFSAERYFD